MSEEVHGDAPPPLPYKPDLASRAQRFAGAVIDYVLSLAVLLPALYALGAFDPAIEEVMRAFEQPHDKPPTFDSQFETQFDLAVTLQSLLVSWAALLLMHGYLLLKHGQTIGKRIVGTRIVDRHGALPGAGPLIGLRYLLMGLLTHIPLIGGPLWLLDALLIFRESHRCLHDDLAKTDVVRVKAARQESSAAGART